MISMAPKVLNPTIMVQLLMISDLLNMFFNGGKPQTGKKEMPKVRPTEKPIEVTLENIYNGKIISFPHQRARCCEDCGGKGGEGVVKCKACKGQGAVVKMFQMGPGMYQQMQQACE